MLHPMRRPQLGLTFPSTRTSPPSGPASYSGSHDELPRVRPIRAGGRPGLDGGARQPGGDGRRQSQPPRDRADDARQGHSWRRTCYSWRPVNTWNMTCMIRVVQNLLVLLSILPLAVKFICCING